jgi:hypothetical protein
MEVSRVRRRKRNRKRGLTIKCSTWDVMPCSLVGVPEENTVSYLQERRVSQVNIKPADSLLELLYSPEDGGSMFL